jgi:hypothetical protein
LLVRRLVLRCGLRRSLLLGIFLGLRLLRPGIGGLWSLWSLGWRLVSWWRGLFYRGLGDYANFGCALLLWKSKDLTQRARRKCRVHRDTNGTRFPAVTRRKSEAKRTAKSGCATKSGAHGKGREILRPVRGNGAGVRMTVLVARRCEFNRNANNARLESRRPLQTSKTTSKASS